MAKRFLLLTAVLFSWTLIYSQCQYENETKTLGIGLVEYDNYNHKEPVIQIFEDPNLTDLFAKWSVYEDEAPCCAKFHKSDYGIAEFVVIDSTSNSYKILTNNDEIKYIPKTIDYVFWSWEEYLTESFGIRRKRDDINIKNQPIKSSPDLNSSTIQLPDERYELLCVLAVKDDWIKIKYDCFYNKDNNQNEGMPCSTYISECTDSAIGWLKWKNDNKLLIDIFTMP
ncbi:hypothetical protein [Zhouia amylolytica]|uniref:hypothetical protein n=1 Tax=Zhouia amylolytica TaxID=376730 RepID=UPI0020CB6DA1|nr:hypothetical protein [Zhouia amylolytica]MCQ0112608.1 hypothetical protein [Zhouia amylolytica]